MPSITRKGQVRQDADHVLAVGDFGTILRWNGRAWNSFSAGTEAFLHGVCARALDDIVVVGLSGTTTHFDGRRWSRRATGTTADLLGVTPFDGMRWRAAWVARDDTAYAVGDSGTLRKRLPCSAELTEFWRR